MVTCRRSGYWGPALTVGSMMPHIKWTRLQVLLLQYASHQMQYNLPNNRKATWLQKLSLMRSKVNPSAFMSKLYCPIHQLSDVFLTWLSVHTKEQIWFLFYCLFVMRSLSSAEREVKGFRQQIFFFCFFFFPFIFISWRLITLQYCSGFCHTLTWISHGFTCVPHPDPPSYLPLHPIPLCLPSAPGRSTCLMHPIWASDLFHRW